MSEQKPSTVAIKDGRGVVVGEHNVIYQYFLANDRKLALSADLLTFDSLIEARTHEFVGRQFVFDRLDEFLKNNSSGYFAILGDPGIGKTCLSCELIRRRHYLHHFNDARVGITGTDMFLRNICVQLIARHNLTRDYSPLLASASGKFLGDLLEDVSHASRSTGEKTVIVVDALDEAETLPDPRANVLFLPPELPPGVYFVVTTRQRADLALTLKCPNQPLVIDALSDANRSDMGEWLERLRSDPSITTWLDRQIVNRDWFVDALMERSEGNFMYLYHVVKSIREGRYRDVTFQELPVGLMGYYEEHWRQMRARDRGEWITYRLPLICLLGAAREPLSVEQFTKITGLPGPRVLDALRDWSEFLHEEMRDNRKCYAIYHSRFRDFLADKTHQGEADLKQAHKDLARWSLAEWRQSRPRKDAAKTRGD